MDDTEKPIDSVKHPAIVEARQRLRGSGERSAEAFLADGARLVSQALDAAAPVEHLFFLQPLQEPEQVELLERGRALGLRCWTVNRGVFFKLLGLGYETSVSVLAVIRRPGCTLQTILSADGAVLVGERIQDPRNVGVLVRTVDAWGLPCAAFSRDSADPYSRAAVRSSTGSIFRVPLALPEDMVACVRAFREQSVRIIGTSAHAAVPCWQEDLTGRCAIVLGNESTGLSEALGAACDAMVTIPMGGGAASFNVTVAAGILLYERARQRRTTAGNSASD